VLDLLVAGIAVGVIVLAVLFKDSTTGGQVGVALNMVLVANATLVKLVQSWTTLEMSLGAISRLKTLEDETPMDDKSWQTLIPPEEWPSAGAVQLKNLTAGYR
jgi:ATP-binding cassette subfamily C (CFTR/MRP) protein 1